MRRYTISFAILLAIIAFSPTQATAAPKGERGERGGGDKQSAGTHVDVGPQGGPAAGVHVGVAPQGTGPRVGVGVGVGPGINGPGVSVGVGAGPNTGERQVYDYRNRPLYRGGNEGREDWRYRWDNGRWWFWGPGNRWLWYHDGQWVYYGNPYSSYVVQRPIIENYSGGPIKIVNPASSGVTLNYMLNDIPYTIPPGYSQDLQADRAWVIQFNRGATTGEAQYGLQPGVYTFTRTDHGWELYRSDFPQTITPSAPAAPSAPTPAPANPY